MEAMSVSVCTYAGQIVRLRELISKTKCPNFINFVPTAAVAVARSSSGSVVIRYEGLYTFGFHG